MRLLRLPSRHRHRVPPARPRLEHNAVIYCPTARCVSDFPLDKIAAADLAIGADGQVFKERHGAGNRVAEPYEIANATVIASGR